MTVVPLFFDVKNRRFKARARFKNKGVYFMLKGTNNAHAINAEH